jgi:ribulose-phosphate 3-epimerase
MGIAKIGHQGEPFDKRAMYLLERLRQRYPNLALQVDGGVTMENAYDLVKAGATRIIVGHDIWDAEDPIEEIKKLQVEANKE